MGIQVLGLALLTMQEKRDRARDNVQQQFVRAIMSFRCNVKPEKPACVLSYIANREVLQCRNAGLWTNTRNNVGHNKLLLPSNYTKHVFTSLYLLLMR